MAAKWYYGHEGQRQGPMSLDELRQLVASGQVKPTDLVWESGMPEWRPANTITDLLQKPDEVNKTAAIESTASTWLLRGLGVLVIFALGTIAATSVILLWNRHNEEEHALAVLQTHVPDSDCVFMVGKHLCFVNGDGIKEMPSLMACKDKKLRELIIAELTPPTSPQEQMKLGDNWWDCAGDRVGSLYNNMQERSAYWYRLASPNLKGPAKAQIRKRLDDIAKRPADFVVLDRKTDYNEADATVRSANLLLEVKKAKTRGVAHAGVELKGVQLLNVEIDASPDVERKGEQSFAGFIVDYHTDTGYTKRVALSIGNYDKTRQFKSPAWGKGSVPDEYEVLGRQPIYKLDLRKWAPPRWTGQVWFTATLQKPKPDAFISAQLIPVAHEQAPANPEAVAGEK